MSGNSTWLRVRKDRLCPICYKSDWCLVSADGSAAICARIADGAVRPCGEAGYLHRLVGKRNGTPYVRIATLSDQTVTQADLAILSRNYQTAVHPARLQRLADTLGVSVASLHRENIGWAHDHGAWAFPMQDAAGAVVGIRLRLDSGRKFSVAGGHEGLFIPSDLPIGGELLICEGPTDTAAMLDLGFAAVGRPSCMGGVRLLVALVQARKPASVVILADGDTPGQRGAETLGSVLCVYSRRVRIIAPPAGVKDARAWKHAGATNLDVRAAIDFAPTRKLSFKSARRAQGVQYA